MALTQNESFCDPLYDAVLDQALNNTDVPVSRFLTLAWFYIQILDSRLRETADRSSDDDRVFVLLGHIIHLVRFVGGGKEANELRAKILRAARISEKEKTRLHNLEQHWNSQENDLPIEGLQQEPMLNEVPESYQCTNCGQLSYAALVYSNPHLSGRYLCEPCWNSDQENAESVTGPSDGTDDQESDVASESDDGGIELRGGEEAASEELSTMADEEDGGTNDESNGNSTDKSRADTATDIVEADHTGMSELKSLSQRRRKDMEEECRPTFYDLSQTSLEKVQLEHGQLEPRRTTVEYVHVEVDGKERMVEFKQYQLYVSLNGS